eukprot:CAMPEP_0183301892 /NCGR_PEP_ID=MMETSP0160_2-20130417/7869_1 /TAXON_ID=2839 ORGANISM="Odontella Sinensis, Strain Grunow 1884" /NCGR_SAMPLE_ID=MMETSP0160_2 /ASSEMBLY_ACC=CAM_ASM_000250 /LENGTH=254 /DNA_ID=CAMNT_0025464591 /DNA_START=29 /DNA_END=793 /DNA_ORIENTATION=-
MAQQLLRATSILVASTLFGQSAAFGTSTHCARATAFASAASLANSFIPVDRRNRVGANVLKMSSSSSESVKRVLVPIGDGSEEIETTCITDTLTRFGASVTVASVKPDGELVCTMSRGIKFLADATIADAVNEEWDYIVCPGGVPGAKALSACEPLMELMKKQNKLNKRYAAICAAPALVLSPHGLADDAATCYPAPDFIAALKSHSDDDVVVSGNMVTSKGPGTSLKFALQLGEELYGKEKADEIAEQMLVKR